MRHTLLYAHKARRIGGFILTLAICLVLLAACGNSTNTGSSGGSTPTPAPTATSSGSGGLYGNGGTTSTPTATATAASTGNLVRTTTATVSGKAETILTNAQGMTLYYRTSDAPPTSVCSGGCAGAWPPLLASGSNTPTGSSALTGKLTVVTDANGSQVAYNGHLLYTYAGDTAPGQTTGQGVAGIWFVATPSLT